MIMSGNYELMYVSISILFIAYAYANKFTIAGMGEDFSKNLGLNYQQVVNLGLIIVALVTAAVVLSIGVIPFLGLIIDRKSTRLNSSHVASSYAVFCLKKKKH